MAKKRKATTKKSPAKPRGKSAGKAAVVQATPAQLGQPAGTHKLNPEDTVMGLMIAVAIAIVLAALYLYQQNVKPKAPQAELLPMVARIATC